MNILHISAPKLHFLVGKPLERLKDGATVSFLGQISILNSDDSNAAVQARAIARFALSYDIWAEKFKATRFSREQERSPRSFRVESDQRLGRRMVPAESFPRCQPVSAQDRPIWVRFELRVEEGQDGAGVVGDPGINLTRLIELFSRPARPRQPSWERLDTGPLRLADLRKTG